MNKIKYIGLWLGLCLVGSGCTTASVDNSVDKPAESGDNPVETVGITTELSTEAEITVDNYVDNLAESVDEPLKAEDNSPETVENSVENHPLPSEVSLTAKKYYTYFMSRMKTLGGEADLLYSEAAFTESWAKVSEEPLHAYWTNTSWFWRGSYWSLQLDPSPFLFAENCENAYVWMARCIRAYDWVQEHHSEDELWDHPDSLEPQYFCHAIFAGSGKLPWYIEPHRTETDFLVICAYKGNPEPSKAAE